MASPFPFTAAALGALIFLLSVADARIPSDFKAIEVRATEPFPDSTNPATKPNILLPSEAASVEPESTEIESHAAASKLPEEIPLTILKFRPINRHFPTRPTYRIVHSGHNCRHGVSKQRPWTPRYGRIRDLPFDDALAAAQESVPHVPTTNLENAISDEIKKLQYEHRHRSESRLFLHRLRQGDFAKEWMTEPESNENLIVKKIRKFLNHF